MADDQGNPRRLATQTRRASRGGDGGEHLGLLHEERFLDHVAMLVTDCWSEDRSGPAHAQCPEVGTPRNPK